MPEERSSLKRERSRSPIRDREKRSGDRDRRRADSSTGFSGIKSRNSDTQSDKMVYISNVPYEVRWMELKDLVREHAGEVNFVELLETADGRSKGCAVVEFKDRESAQKCVETMHRMSVNDRLIIVKEIRDPERFFRKVKEETGLDFLSGKGNRGSGMSTGGTMSTNRGRLDAPAPISFETYGLSPAFLAQLGVDGPLTNRVFVANLPYNLPPSRIRDLFQICGRVTDVDLYLDKEGHSKGISVVEFSHPIEAVQSISMLHNQKYQDRTLAVRLDRQEKHVDLRRPGELPSGLRAVGMGLGANGAPLTNVSQLMSQSQQGGPAIGFGGGVTGGGSNFGGPPEVNLGGGNLGFSGSGLGSSRDQLSTNAYSFGSLSNAAAALLESGRGNGNLYDDRERFYDRTSSQVTNLSDDRWHSMRGSASASLSSRLTVVVKNLPIDFTWQRLKDLGREAGDVEFVEMIGAGVGRIRFKLLEDAERAIRGLHGYVMENRPLHVDYA